MFDLHSKLCQLEVRVTALERVHLRLDRYDGCSNRLEAVEERFGRVTDDLADLKSTLARIEGKLSG
ncbi:hypothetical protein [Nonomuraea sp. NPDC050783]|uniref:hypothetical protein n=1 Tax=Nonomuraea sp. NPDC050783 TaxID=3154634 RepID=UPI003465F765